MSRRAAQPDSLLHCSRPSLAAMVRTLELESLRLTRRVDELAEELACSQARERDLIRRLSDARRGKQLPA